MVPDRKSPAAAALPPFEDVTDLAAIAEVSRGNREMFEVIVRRYNQLLYRVGWSYLRDHMRVEDAMQNTYVKAFLHLRAYHGEAAFSTWLTRIMINECLMTIRRHRSRPELALETVGGSADDTDAFNAQEPNGDHPAAEQLNRHEMKAMLETAIALLPRKFRTVYVLREVQQLSTAEVAAALNVSTASVKVDLHRARERLKAELLKSATRAELFPYPAQFCDPLTARVMASVTAISPA